MYAVLYYAVCCVCVNPDDTSESINKNRNKEDKLFLKQKLFSSLKLTSKYFPKYLAKFERFNTHKS